VFAFASPVSFFFFFFFIAARRCALVFKH